jgi:hypothetical protein
MGQKLLIMAACLIAGETIGIPVAVGDTVDVPKDDALYLVRAGRALYLDKADDPTKGLHTATAEDKQRAKDQAKAIAAAAEATAKANNPPDFAGMLAQAVAQGMAMAMAQQAKQGAPAQT